LAGREEWPRQLAPDRVQRALDGLVRDGLAVRDGDRARLA
jgi:hypothetical protein